VLRKKYTVQKSFRIDEKLSEDLENLAAILERPQNDLVNVSLEQLMKENTPWFKDNIIVDCFDNFFKNGTESERFEMDGVAVDIYYLPDKSKIEVDFRPSDGFNNENTIDQASYEFSENETDNIKKKLREFTMYLHEDSPKVQNFLKSRMDYR